MSASVRCLGGWCGFVQGPQQQIGENNGHKVRQQSVGRCLQTIHNTLASTHKHSAAAHQCKEL